MSADTGGNSVRSRTGNGLTYFTSFVLMASGAVKFARVPKVAEQMASVGFSGGKLTLIAFLEVISAVLLAWPRSRPFGLVMVSAYLGGAICAHVAHDQLPLQPTVVLYLIWLAIWLRRPELLWGDKPAG